jgi:hypothetical protein
MRKKEECHMNAEEDDIYGVTDINMNKIKNEIDIEEIVKK